MTTETVLTDEKIIMIGQQVCAIEARENRGILPFAFARAIEQAVLQSPEIQELRKDARRLDKLEQDYFEPVEGGIRKHIDYQIEVDAETFGPKSKPKLKLVVSK